MTRIVLAELSRVGAQVSLETEAAAALASTGLVELRPIGGGTWQVVPAGRVGAVSVGGVDIHVVPKIGISRLLFLLGYAHDPGFRPDDTPGQAEPDLWPALAESLARQAERALLQGVRQGYVTVDDSLAVVRGRVRIADQIARRPGMLLPLEVRYDDYSRDIAENQILRTAVRLLAAVPRLAPTLKARLKHLDARLEGVSVLRLRSPLPSWRVTRLNRAYVPAVRLAEIILRHYSAEPGPGNVAVTSFVVNMAKVFEDFLFTAVKEALRSYPGATHSQYQVNLDESGHVPMKPDIVHLISSIPVAVFDAKYKLEDPKSGYPNADVYQMLAYCTALQLNCGWLVYAHGTGSTARAVRHSDIHIQPYPLDLTRRPDDILSQLDILAMKAVPTSLALIQN
ncbi:McrC family protein [Catelliglobosispora koreensis]|uniref:McrC family protein n=1 Tax=Catelliglobosispora koreensis TaxID=129052 RepID=UPI000379170F|nr:hypothetical protein [Catelliglobosispora koreensis]